MMITTIWEKCPAPAHVMLQHLTCDALSCQVNAGGHVKEKRKRQYDTNYPYAMDVRCYCHSLLTQKGPIGRLESGTRRMRPICRQTHDPHQNHPGTIVTSFQVRSLVGASGAAEQHTQAKPWKGIGPVTALIDRIWKSTY